MATPATWWISTDVWWPAFVVLTPLSAALEFVAVPLPRGGMLSIATIPHVATILLVPHPFAALSIGLAVLVEEAIHRMPPQKAAFNVAGYVLTASAASFATGVFGNIWLAAAPGRASHVVVVSLFVTAGAVYYGVNAILVALIISAASGQSFRFLLRANTRNTGLSELGGASVGMLFALIWVAEPVWTALLALPAAVISRSLQHIRQLQSETRDAVRSLAEIVDHRDSTTFHHSERVTAYAVALARELDLSDEATELIEQAAAVHDLGKIGVPDRILLKTGALTDEERRTMWLHTEVGAEVLRRYQLFREGAEIVRHHHESYDGTGYPDGIAGEAIPVGARVVSVADAFDAMTSDRPYRLALPVDTALARLRAGAGVQWDPVVVGAFVRLVMDGRVELPAGQVTAPDDEPVLDHEELRDPDHPSTALPAEERAVTSAVEDR
ncbi:MAG: HD-GYP domain-containing protein [Chloroflexota bacterium]|nr:HD-GYP domain-containing protein [Chloroflexota bacterium]